jgi:hypothetical protein
MASISTVGSLVPISTATDFPSRLDSHSAASSKLISASDSSGRLGSDLSLTAMDSDRIPTRLAVDWSHGRAEVEFASGLEVATS